MDMAAAEVEEELQQPLVLLLNPLFPSLEEALSKKFHFLKPWEKPSMPTHIFLAAHAQSVKAMLSQSLTPIDSAPSAAFPTSNSSKPRAPALITLTWVNAGEEESPLAVLGQSTQRMSQIMPWDSCLTSFTESRLQTVTFNEATSRERKSIGFSVPRLRSRRPQNFIQIRGKQVGIVGLGSIGLEIAKRLEAFGCSISYNSISSKPFVPFPYIASVQDLAARSDIIIVSCALTDETHHVINRNVLLALGKEGIVINIGRGPLIDEKELVNCLVRGEIGRAGLDVFNEEPDVPMELFAVDNVVLSPHRAFCTAEGFSSLIELITSNLGAFFSNRPLLTPVEEDY